MNRKAQPPKLKRVRSQFKCGRKTYSKTLRQQNNLNLMMNSLKHSALALAESSLCVWSSPFAWTASILVAELVSSANTAWLASMGEPVSSGSRWTVSFFFLRVTKPASTIEQALNSTQTETFDHNSNVFELPRTQTPEHFVVSGIVGAATPLQAWTPLAAAAAFSACTAFSRSSLPACVSPKSLSLCF